MFIDSETDEVVESFPIDFRRVATATAADPVLATVLRFVATQWPLSKSRIEDPLVRRFFAHKERLFVRRGVLLLRSDNDQSRVVVPRSLQSSVLRLLHQGHWGIVRTKQLARQHCTWFGIDAAITNMCSSCPACAEQQSAPPRKVFAWPKATSPWQRLHIDFAGPFWNARWLVLVDAFSNFPFVVRMSSTTSSATIQALSAIFCIEGLPQTIVSDNGPQFMSAEFQSFCQANGIQHLTSAPFSPQSNGAAERLVRTFKSQMLKLKESHSREDALLLFLSSYRSQPRDGRSPAELLHGRPHRTLMSLLHPPHQVPVQRQTPAFAPGDVVFYRNYRAPQTPRTVASALHYPARRCPAGDPVARRPPTNDWRTHTPRLASAGPAGRPQGRPTPRRTGASAVALPGRTFSPRKRGTVRRPTFTCSYSLGAVSAFKIPSRSGATLRDTMVRHWSRNPPPWMRPQTLTGEVGAMRVTARSFRCW
ncbi:uncharacterized protein K02A2.6-like [Schistocerca serialis cubense]|uniref:uncharacterized protein K02A2.6-like n=1 Tax=Schistocerca serialis cubense TaxID=2023355 RepID=UPI00214E4842|nr:uncharacterized protein K02A2.6-like [Schistocerca serialis cubense]